jgi:opacity protein-like surface antigen
VAVNGVSDSDSDDGLVLGAGLETRVGSAASLRVEYVRSDYNDFVKNNAVLAGVAYRF